MEIIKIEKASEAKIRVRLEDRGIALELSEHFCFFADGYKYTPAFKNGSWDGKIRLFNGRDYTLPYGLLPKLMTFAKERGYKVDLSELSSNTTIHKGIEDIFNLDLRDDKGGEIKARDYQIKGVTKAMSSGRCLLLSPTGSGKSLMIYLMIRHFLKNDFDSKVLLVVPTVSLVTQMYKDFGDYSQCDSSFNNEEECHMIYSGKEKHTDKPIVISTWQSLITQPKNYFHQFGMVIGDEAHQCKAKSLQTILENLINAYYRIGTTGTLDDIKVNKWVLEGGFGPIFKATNTADLIKSGELSKLEILCKVFDYSKDERKIFRSFKPDYKFEYNYLIMSEKRNNLIVDDILKAKHNSLVLFQQVKKHGEPLYNLIKERAPDRELYFVSGKVKADDRERVRELTEKTETGIVLHFGNKKILVQDNDLIPLTNGDRKKAKDITEEDDVSDRWIKTK